jgi:YtfJ family uncharacterized protein
MQRSLLFLILSLANLAWASNIQVGEPLPELSIAEHGELILHEEDEISYQAWQSPHQPEKVHVLQYLAGTMSARNQTRAFTDRLENTLPKGSYEFTTVINLDDAMWGTGGFVMSEVKSSKRKYPDSTIVLDEAGAGRQAWQLEKKSSAVVVIDGRGTVLYLKEGLMTEEEIEAAVEIIRLQISESES